MDLEKKSNEQDDSQEKEDTEIHESFEFNFPFKPYNIQVELMKVAYETYENSKFALLESPTGTGKSLSIICSALSWLGDHKTKVKQQLLSKKDELLAKIEDLKKEEEVSGDWLSVQTKRRDIIGELGDATKEIERIEKFEQRSEARRHAKLHGGSLEDYSAFQRRASVDDTELVDQDNDKLIGSQESQKEPTPDEIEKKVTQLEEDHIKPKIYYASRTHSQLSQFINEIKKTKFADFNSGPPVKVTPLASRANLCVNPDVLKLKDPSAINERCMEMQKETSADKKCPYIKYKQVNHLKEDILTTVHDIEDLVSRGRTSGACPYYASRMAVPEADVVVVPYNNLLHRETRKASSLDLKENIVIVDEAHNILDTICSIHSAPITGQQLVGSHTIFSKYHQKYQSRMNPRNAAMIMNIVQCLAALIKYLENPKKHLNEFEQPESVNLNDEKLTERIGATNQVVKNDGKNSKLATKHEEYIVDVNKFIGAANIGRFNIFKIIDFLHRSQLARKLLGFFRQDSSEESSPKKKRRKCETSPSYPIYILVEFLKSLTNVADDGKILTEHFDLDVQQSSLKFLLLNPSSQFQQMIQEARSIVLAGGTMQPFTEFIDLLFGPLKVDKSRLNLFSCGHVISKSQLYAATLSHGPTGKPIELSYKTRSSLEIVDEIGRTIMNISSMVPGGMVCFLPSYEYEQFCFNRWTQIGVISKIETRSKHVFREPKQSSQVRPVLEEYARMIEKGKNLGRGAMLLCVVGGKMSEGINFNDDLGRCVVMVGLPYANIKSGELQQKMSYYDRTCKNQSCNEHQRSAGQRYYENLCIKGVNQSIGRAIRHQDDYAAIILLDRRYSTKSSIITGLAGWIRQSLVDHERFGPMFGQLKEFYHVKR